MKKVISNISKAWKATLKSKHTAFAEKQNLKKKSMIGFTVCRKSRSNPTIQICLPFSYHPANPLSEFLLEAVFNLK